MKLKSVVFDMDGTLVDSLGFNDRMWEYMNSEYIGQENFRLDAEVDKNTRTMIFSQALLYVKDYYGIDASDEEFLDFFARKLEYFYKYEATVKKGAVEILEDLKSKGIKLCLASATDKKYVLTALKSAGLYDYFDFVISCSEVGSGKERPDVYFKALELLGSSVEDTCVVEDAYVALETAKSIGLKTVGVFDNDNVAFQDRVKASSDIYLGEGHGLEELINIIE